jgi:hypothetical protein
LILIPIAALKSLALAPTKAVLFALLDLLSLGTTPKGYNILAKGVARGLNSKNLMNFGEIFDILIKNHDKIIGVNGL